MAVTKTLRYVSECFMHTETKSLRTLLNVVCVKFAVKFCMPLAVTHEPNMLVDAKLVQMKQAVSFKA